MKKYNCLFISYHTHTIKNSILSGFLYTVWTEDVTQYDGTIVPYEFVTLRDTVKIIAVTDNGMYVVLQAAQPHRGEYLDMPGGLIDPGEDRMQAAMRELREEAGMVSDDISLFGAYPYEFVGGTRYVALMKNCKKIGPQSLDAGERIEVLEVSKEDYMRLVVSGELHGSREIRYEFVEGMRDGK